jgi:hypothetical protein
MSKSKQIVIRISVEDHDFVKKMGASYSQIWQVGFEKWSLDFPDYLQKKVQEYKFLYSQCINKMQDCNNIVYTKRKDLDELYKVYVENGRSIQNPSPHDKSWIRARITKLGNGITMDKFFEYCKKRFEDDKQKRLEVLE